ncbi:MAG: hypothetical protein ACFE85_19725 [Candidatus Hodarchaeota archaeon]
MRKNKSSPKELVKIEEIKKILEIIEKYEKLYEEIGIEVLILEAFTLDKPLTEIEIRGKKLDDVLSFIDELNDFFYVGSKNSSKKSSEFDGVVHISRFKSILDISLNYLSNDFADIRGILFGIPIKEIAEFCTQNELEGLNLIKM